MTFPAVLPQVGGASARRRLSLTPDTAKVSDFDQDMNRRQGLL
ncbi:MAG TPA: hypothetical protein VGX92_05560 [Pyrinomonadaceae bacterium]|nr:hypothetical protein [Pyrinomonadaceae bacterium]